MATEEDLSKYEHIQVIRGFPFPAPFQNAKFFNRDFIEGAMDYMPKDNDLIIASYPKTGTTWMQYIVMQIVSKATVYYSFDDVSYKIYPYMEMAGIEAVEALEGDRIYKHHMPYNLVQKNERAKTIYTYRHPEDTVVSYYHFYRSLPTKVKFENFEEFFNFFVTGVIGYGNYFKHVLSFYQHRDDTNLLMVSYEKLHADGKKEVLRVARFIGEEHYVYLMENEDVMDKVMERTSFDYMKKNLTVTSPGDEQSDEKNKMNFFRKGIVGDGKSMLSKEQRERIKEAAEILKGTSVYDEWYP